MAASDASPFPIKAQAYRVTFPILDADGDLVTGAAGLDSEISKDGGTFADCTNEATQIATSSGMYYLDLTATEMNADTVAIIVKTSTTDAKTTPIVLYPVTLSVAMLGTNMVQISGDSNAADNLEAACDGNTYNVGGGAVVAASVTAEVSANVTKISGDGTAADNAEAFFDGTGYAGTNNVIPTVTTLTGHTAQTGDAFARLGAPAGASVSADIAAVKSDTAAILTDTGTTLDTLIKDIPTVAEFEARTLVAADYVVVGDTLAAVTTVGSVTGAVGSVTAEVSADVVKISGDSTAADRLEAILDATPNGAVVDDNDPDPSTTAFETNLSEATNDHYNGAFVVFTSGALLGQSRKISDYDGTTKVVTVATAFTEAPAGADTFIIIGRSE